jgi:hypothetical protein
VGDNRSITGGEAVTHVTGSRKTQVGGHDQGEFFSGRTTIVHGARKTTILASDDITVMAGRTEQWLARKGELFLGGKYEIGGPVKSETILGAKHTTVVGAKIDNVSGAAIVIGKAAAIKTAPNWKGLAGMALNKIGVLKYKTESAELKADGKVLIKAAQVVLVGDFIELKGPVRVTESLIVDGKIYQDGKALTGE